MKLRADGVRYVVTGEGNGPVNALDQALREAIGQAYPEVAKFELIDYKVRILDQGHGTDAITRVLIETTDGESSWVTVGVGANVIEASWGALVDGAHLRPAPPPRGLRTAVHGRLTVPPTGDAFRPRTLGCCGWPSDRRAGRRSVLAALVLLGVGSRGAAGAHRRCRRARCHLRRGPPGGACAVPTARARTSCWS